MGNQLARVVILVGVSALANVAWVQAENFKSADECVVGRRVVNNGGEKGKIVRRADETMCTVLLDATGKEKTSLFWMLRADGASAETDDKLVSGTYACYEGVPNHYTFMDLTVTGTTYEWAGERGRLHVEPSRKIVFESGPLEAYTSKLLAGPSVGLNSDGGSFFGTHCDFQKK